MAKVTRVVGKIISNMVKQDSPIKKDKAKWACGITERESNGLKVRAQQLSLVENFEIIELF